MVSCCTPVSEAAFSEMGKEQQWQKTKQLLLAWQRSAAHELGANQIVVLSDQQTTKAD
jgi:hypothetical protein